MANNCLFLLSVCCLFFENLWTELWTCGFFVFNVFNVFFPFFPSSSIKTLMAFEQSWALSVFLNIFNNKKWFFAFFIKFIWLGMGFLNRTGAEIGYLLYRKCKKLIFYCWKNLKIPKVPSFAFEHFKTNLLGRAMHLWLEILWSKDLIQA